jgi:hypothetical protein
MSIDDVVQVQDVIAARTKVMAERRKVLATSVIAAAAAVFVAFVATYEFSGSNALLSAFIAILFLAQGMFVFGHWMRHYQNIFKQLAAVEERVSSGETIYGSQLIFRPFQ